VRPGGARRDGPAGGAGAPRGRQGLPWRRARAARPVPATGTCSPTVRVDRSSALVRSSAVCPGACSAQPARTDTLLSSLIDRSMPPVTVQVPSRVTSAPTDSRGALSTVPPTLDLEYTLPTRAPPLR